MATTTAAPDKKIQETHKSPATAADQMAELDRQIEALRQKKLELNQTAIHEQKLRVSDARRALDTELAKLEELTGRPTGEPRAKRTRRPSISDDALKDQLLKVMAAHGKEGMNAKALAEKMNVDAIRIRKYIKDNSKVLKRTGAGPGTKFFLP